MKSVSFKTKVVSMGRITIPAEIRKSLEIEDGDIVEVESVRKLVLVAARAEVKT